MIIVVSMEVSQIKVKKIFTQRVACELISKGHELLRVEDNLKHRHLKVFVFKETLNLLEDLTRITNRK